ncbi:MAG: glycosyltransferase family 39 protein [Bacteroidales bacterium]|nr:glycosyltransferase family 39 protein [Bacteroidales bacterium]
MIKLSQFIRYCFEEKPLLFCIWLAFVLRIFSVVFSQGIVFGFDHYVYVENAQNIVNGELTFSALYDNIEYENFSSHGYSLIYLIVNTSIFYTLEFFNMFDSRGKMLILRLFHALISLYVIYYSYRLAYRLANRRAALAVGLVVSSLWFMPFLSVKTLPENIAAIFLLAGIYRFAKTNKRNYKYGDDLFVGLLLGLSTAFCLNSLFFVLGFAVAIGLITSKRRSLLLLSGAGISVFITEGIVNMIFLGSPFYILKEYFSAILLGDLTTHGAKTLYMYISLLVLMIPFPWGFLAVFGYIKSWKRTFILFFPVTFYIIICYLLPYKGEQFVLPIMPLFFIICLAGWYRYSSNSRFWASKPRLRYWVTTSFFIVNTPVLILSCFAFVRKPQVESMVYLSHFKNDITSIMVENSTQSSCKSLPMFYLGKNVNILTLNAQETEPDISIYYCAEKNSQYEKEIFTENYFLHCKKEEIPQFILFYSNENIPERLSRLRKIFPQIAHAKTITPSYADDIIELVNPGNKNQEIQIYKTDFQE